MASENSRTIQSDKTLIRILESLQESEGARIGQIASELDLADSTVHGHLTTLREHGLITKRGEEYHVGLRFLEFGVRTRNTYPLYQTAKSRVDELAQDVQEKVWCIVEENGRAVYLYGTSGYHSVKTYATEGQVSDLHHLAGGKAILANLPKDRRQNLLDELKLEPKTEKTITNREVLCDEFETIKSRGYAINDEESMEGLRAISAPVKKPDSGVFGAISISGPAKRLSQERIETTLVEKLTGLTNELEISILYE